MSDDSVRKTRPHPAGFTVPDLTKPIEIELENGAKVMAEIAEVSDYGICLRYEDQAGRRYAHWFHSTGTRMGDNDDKPVRFIDRFGAVVLL